MHTAQLPRPAYAALAAFLLTLVVLVAAGAGAGDSSVELRDRALAAAEAPVPRPSASAAERVAALREQLRLRPTADGYAALAGAYLQLFRETADASAYTRADAAIKRSLARDPANPAALIEASALAAALHRFPEALALARQARAAAPDVVKSYGILVDSLVELGRLPAAERALQRMVDAQPTSSAYARVSYLRELRGDLPGALAAMELAVSAGGEVPEHAASLRALLGDLELHLGRTAAAERSYRGALARFPALPKAELGLARLDMAAGRFEAARQRLAALVERLPQTDHVVALGEAELALGHGAQAKKAFALASADFAQLAAAGENTQAEAAVFEADHGSPRRAVRLGREAVTVKAGLRSADSYGWALTRAGRPEEGLEWARRALRLNASDPAVALHAGVAAAGAGKPRLARRLLETALRSPAVLGPWQTREARRELAALR